MKCFFYCLIFCFFACKTSVEEPKYDKLADYLPLKVGSTFTYQYDSTVLNANATQLVGKSYRIKDSIESQFTDAIGRKSYRVFRYINNANGTSNWQILLVYSWHLSSNQIESSSNNLSVIHLTLPIKDSSTWKGHALINTAIATNNGTSLSYLSGWDFRYRGVGASYQVPAKNFTNTITVLQDDTTTPQGNFDPNLVLQRRTYGVEVYAKDVGLIFKDFLFWEWQKVNQKFELNSYGIRLQLLSYQIP